MMLQMRAELCVAVSLLACSIIGLVAAEQFAVLVCGSNSFENYRHQADICHAYQILVERGVKPDNIITMLYDDVANTTGYRFPGKLFNRPTPTGTAGDDVYRTCKKDYTGALVNQDTFLAVITANVSGVPAGYPVLRSGPTDHVFINFVDHGGPGILYFMDATHNMKPMYSFQLFRALKTMEEKKMFAKLVMYVDACQSGSVFDGVLPNNTQIYVETSANPDEPAYASYCPGQWIGNYSASSVNGTEIGVCIGDVYSSTWMERIDALGILESFDSQYKAVRDLTNTSQHVMRYGDFSFIKTPVGQFIGNMTYTIRTPFNVVSDIDVTAAPQSLWISYDIPLKYAQHVYNQYLAEDRFGLMTRQALTRLSSIVAGRKLADDVFSAFIANVNIINATVTKESLLAAPKLPIVHTECMIVLDQTYMDIIGYTEYSIQYVKVFINACRQHNNSAQLVKALTATRTVFGVLSL